MKRILSKIFLNENIVLIVIVLNAAIIFAQESGCNVFSLSVADLVCTLFFMVEMGGDCPKTIAT